MKDGKYVILCVDDDPDVHETIKVILESNGYQYEGAMTGEEALKNYDAIQPDFLLLDLMMEEVDAGTQFAKELKAKGNKAPVYMLTSVGDQMNANIDTSALGITGVFQKPINPGTLLNILKTKLQ